MKECETGADIVLEVRIWIKFELSFGLYSLFERFFLPSLKNKYKCNCLVLQSLGRRLIYRTDYLALSQIYVN